jgi:hypothetical protein
MSTGENLAHILVKDAWVYIAISVQTPRLSKATSETKHTEERS